MAYVYKITILPTNEYYIGAQYNKNANINDLGSIYFSSSGYVQSLLFDYGRKNAKFEVIQEFQNKKECLQEEYRLILENKDDQLCLNKQFCQERNQKVSRWHKQNWKTFDATSRNQKISQKQKELWADENIKKRRSEALKGRSWNLSPEQAQKVTKHLTKEHRQKGTEAVRDSIWINDGNKSKRIKKDQPIPEGFTKGRIESAWNKGKSLN